MAVSWLTEILALKVLLKKSIFRPLVYSAKVFEHRHLAIILYRTQPKDHFCPVLRLQLPILS